MQVWQELVSYNSCFETDIRHCFSILALTHQEVWCECFTFFSFNIFILVDDDQLFNLYQVEVETIKAKIPQFCLIYLFSYTQGINTFLEFIKPSV